MDKKEWQDYSLILKELLSLEYSPIALSCLKDPLLNDSEKKVRICRAILDAGKGQTQRVDKINNACRGAALHLGFRKTDQNIEAVIKEFVVEEEKLLCSYRAFENLRSQMEAPPDNRHSYFILSPMEKANTQPQLALFVVNAESSCRLLTLAIFLDGAMPKIKIGGPTCWMNITYPLLTGEINLSFYDYTARKMCNLEKDKLLITIPYAKIPKMIEGIDKCSAGSAKTEFL
jgi:uncharacterized protein (DUF169 family)